MDFIAATDQLSRKVSHEDLAGELGVSLAAIRQARMDPDSDGYRRPPDGWKAAVAGLARRRAGELLELAAHLEGEG